MTKTELNYLAKRTAEHLYELMQEKQDTYIGSTQAAEFLGIAKQTLFNKIKDIPHVKIDGKLMFSTNALSRYIQNGGAQC